MSPTTPGTPNFLAQLAAEDPQKLEELTALHWFVKAGGIEYERLFLRERPDFLIVVGGRSIGVEITMAERNVPGTQFSAKQIEQAHRKFAEALLRRVNPKLPLDIGLIFNDEIPVDKKKISRALDAIVPKIDWVSMRMRRHSVEFLGRDKAKIRASSEDPFHVCNDVPKFLQHIQLLNDGHKFTCITGSRGGVIFEFKDQDLAPILERKHKALEGYVQCDEHWLVIVAGFLPPIYMPEEPPKILIGTTASTFAGLDVATPIQSTFDRVFYFKSPADVFQLTC